MAAHQISYLILTLFGAILSTVIQGESVIRWSTAMSCLILATHLSMTITVAIIYNSNTGSGRHCQVYPSEYAYHRDSVTRSESVSANCRIYPVGLASEHVNTLSANYIHCNGTQLRLSDSEVGPQCQYDPSYYYEWSAGTVPRQLLFIFPTRINLTTITLHYYCDSQRGLPPLRFYAVADDFDTVCGMQYLVAADL